MNALLELAARCEAATGPDRELFDAAFWAIHGDKPARIHGGSEELTCWLGLYNPFWKMMDARAWLDAAMTLVPPEHTIQLSDWEADVLRAKGPWQAIVLPMGVRGKMSDFTFSNRSDHCWSPALALTAAALRARASIAGDV